MVAQDPRPKKFHRQPGEKRDERREKRKESRGKGLRGVEGGFSDGLKPH